MTLYSKILDGLSERQQKKFSKPFKTINAGLLPERDDQGYRIYPQMEPLGANKTFTVFNSNGEKLAPGSFLIDENGQVNVFRFE